MHLRFGLAAVRGSGPCLHRVVSLEKCKVPGDTGSLGVIISVGDTGSFLGIWGAGPSISVGHDAASRTRAVALQTNLTAWSKLLVYGLYLAAL